MSDPINDICLRVRILNPQRQPLGGAVDIECKPQGSGEAVKVKAADASKDMDVRGLQRTPQGLYQVTVIPTDLFRPTSQFVTVPASGFATAEFVIDKGTNSGGTGDASLKLVVSGLVSNADGTPARGVLIRAFDRDLRSEQLLGEDKKSQYEIHYTRDQFQKSENDTADLIVRVIDSEGKTLVSSPTLFNAPAAAVISLQLPDPDEKLSEFERIVAAIEPLLKGQAADGGEVPLDELTDEDIDFLAGDTGEDHQNIIWLEQSAKLASQVNSGGGELSTTAQPHQAPVTVKAIPFQIFYGWLRQGLPTQLAALIATNENTLKKALQTSQDENIIPKLAPGELDAVLARIHDLNVAQALAPSTRENPPSFGDLLSVALPPEKHTAIASAYVSTVGNADALRKARESGSRMAAIESAVGVQSFLSALGNDPTLTPDDVNQVMTTLALDDFTSSHLPLVRELSRTIQESKSDAGLRGLAQFDEADWINILQKPQNPDDPKSAPIGFPPGEESISSYAHKLNQSIESTYPTAVIANRIERDTSEDSPFQAAKTDLLAFFSNNADFSFADTPPNFYLGADASQKLRDVKDLDATKTQLNKMYRVFNVTRHFQEIRAVLADGLDSASAMVQVGERAFGEKYAQAFGSRSNAIDAYLKALHVDASALTLFLKHATAANSPLPYAISGLLTQSPVVVPDYSTLFGSLDVCNCEHCQSLYSPSAYFVDTLRFIDNCPQPTATSPLQVLLGRRPDLEHIELTCENTNTELPYVDLVNEILEAAVAPRSFNISRKDGLADVLAALNNGELSSLVKTAFASHGYPLTDKASLRPESVAGQINKSKWVILDSSWAFTLSRVGKGEEILVLAWPQTSWTSDELSANPEHIDSPAYDVLRAAVYPWNLPLNLPLEETRVYLSNLGVERHALMETLFPGSPTDAVSDKGVALEYLGLSKEEADIIAGVTAGGPAVGPSPLGPWDFWGLRATANDIVDRAHGSAPHAQGDWNVVLQRVSIFLQQSGVSYRELLELLGTYFVNPTASAGTPGGRLLGIASIDPTDPTTCDLSQLAIQVVDPEVASAKDELIAAWNRIHRFVRLARKLGWTMRDLDKAITSFKPAINDGRHDITAAETTGSDTLFVQLSHIQRLHDDNNLPVINLLAWWSDIDTAVYIDQLSDGEPPVPSLYAQLFANKTVSGQIIGDNPTALSGSLSDKAAAIAAALQISVDDFTLLQATVPNDGTLSLSNLSLCYRHATFAKGLKLSMRDYVNTLALVSSTPFASTATTLQFVKHIDKIRDSEFTVDDLNYLLRNQPSNTSDIAPTDGEIAIVLDAIRGDMQNISADNTFVPAGIDDVTATSDPNGELTRKKLALLKWDPILIEQVIAVLNNTFTYEIDLPALAPTVVFPDSLRTSISYDTLTHKLRFTGTMSAADQALLVAPPNTDGAFTGAVSELFAGPKDFVARYMARFSVPTYSVKVTAANLKSALAALTFPDTLKTKIYYDAVAETLCFVGVMTDAEHSVLSNLSAEVGYAPAIQQLFDAPQDIANAPRGADLFLTSSGANNAASALFDDPADKPQVRFLLVLSKLLPYLQTVLNEIAVKQRLGEYLKFDAPSIDGLLTKWVKPQVVDAAHPEQRAMADFLDPAFVGSSPNIQSSEDVFPRQFSAVVLLHKIASIASKFVLTSRELQWLFEIGPGVGWLDFDALAIGSAATATSLLQGWKRVADLCQLRDALPRGEDLLGSIFDAASGPGAQLDQVLGTLSDGTQWELGNLKSLSGANGFNLAVGDFADEAAIMRLSFAISMVRRLGATADQCLPWAKVPPTADDARAIKSLVRSKYDDAQWLDLAKSLRDPLRERQRSALVAYLLQMLGVAGADELHDRFLIDVEMSPCMMTTRIKQAISSVQLFIQRCLMNLEQNVFLTSTNAEEWTEWRKWYRVWEANRKVLFYPENWLEPELRDDKSPFYKDLENELLQADVTTDSVEDAFLHYLETLDQVARLEIVGIYHQQETGDEPIDILHVFGRTRAVPHLYFYRQFDGGVWSPWEKVDLDIEGDHLIPVIWNRRLQLYWPVFTLKSEQPTKDQRADNDDPNQYWEIKISCSEYKNGGWSSRKVSTDWLRLNKYPYLPTDFPKDPPLDVPQDPKDFSFKTRIFQGADGEQLRIECYGTVVKEIQEPPQNTTSPVVVLTAFLKVLDPHLAFDFGQWKNVPQATYLKCRFQLGSDKLTETQSAHTTVEIRDSSNNVLESIALNSNGIAYSMNGYTAQESVFLVSDQFDVDSVDEAGSWWMPFNPLDYTTFVVEFCFDAIADKTGVDVGQSAIDIAVAAAIVTAVGSGGNIGLILGAVVAAVTTAVSGIAGISGVDIPTIAAQAANEWFGRGFVVTLREHVFPPPPPPPPPVYETTVLIMQGIGQFLLGDCNGDLAAVPTDPMASDMTPSLLTYYQYTYIQNMELVELAGDYPLVSPGRGDAILDTTRSTFSLLAPHQDPTFTFNSPFFFQDAKRTYLVTVPQLLSFAVHFHPYVCDLIKALKRDGIPGLLTLENQRLSDLGADFWQSYHPEPLYIAYGSQPVENVDFDFHGAYSLYNWELFFHIPFQIAIQLSTNQRFEDAQRWFHYIFDPTSTESLDKPGNPGVERFWKVASFYDEALRGVQSLQGLIQDANEISQQVTVWEANPFNPYAIARLRIVAYMKAVVMRYIDNLIAWGDQLFRQDTIESINEATQLYILASEILGPRPENIPPRAVAQVQSFHTLDDVEALDSLSNAKVQIESFLAPSVAPTFGKKTQGVPPLTMEYFCITANDNLLGYWDTVSDRLFKIRHCMNIEGVERTLPIFEPEIDPGLLVRAVAAGVDIASVLNDINAALPPYRFNVMLQKATELCNNVKALGGAFLSALEKQDAEQLALLRSGHEVALLKAMRAVKDQQTKEADNILQGLMKYQDVVTARQQYYLSRPFMNAYEMGHLQMAGEALIPMAAQAAAEVLAAILHLIPDAKLGFFTTVGSTYGGSNVASAIQASGGAAGTLASILNTQGSLSSTLGSYQRRQDDWTHQADLATKELQQVEKQIAAAEIRLAISQQELENHDLQIANAQEVDDYMRYQKFTNQQLYSWMVGQLSGTYFQSYQLAYDVAKRAERAYRYELGLTDSNFIQFGYWDSLKKGLLSGERLDLDLKRMDVAYLEQNQREYEITKHISLNTIDPICLIELRENAECYVNLPEALFDVDYPGHYMRRIKSVSMTIPCVTGPYAGINCTLTQLNSSIRHANTLSGGKYGRRDDDTRFSDSFGAIQSIVTSGGQNDSGLFEANLRDERFLPFEGQGAISSWRIQLQKQFQTFDYDTISDVILHVRYTSRDGGDLLKDQANSELTDAVNAAVLSAGQQGFARAFNLRHEFPTDWYRFLNRPSDVAGDQTLKLGFEKARFPFFSQVMGITVNTFELFVKINPAFATSYTGDTLKITLQRGTTASSSNPLTLDPWNSWLRGDKPSGATPGDWTLAAWQDTGDGVHKRIDAEAIEDIVCVCVYTVAAP